MLKLIRNFDKYEDTIFYNIKNGKITICENEDKRYADGDFVRVENDIYGIIYFRNEILFFKNNERYFLSKLNYKFEYKELDALTGNFKFIVDNKPIIDIDYKKPDTVVILPFFIGFVEPEEDLDFFQYISK